MTLEQFKYNYQAMLNNKKNDFSSAYSPANPNPIFALNLRGNLNSRSWKIKLIVGFFIPIFGFFLIISALIERHNLPSQEDKIFLNKFITFDATTNKSECSKALGAIFGLKELQLGFILAEDHVNNKEYYSLFYEELPKQAGFIFNPLSPCEGTLLLQYKGKTISSHKFYFIGKNQSIDDSAAFKLTSKTLSKIDILRDSKVVTKHTGGMVGALVGAGLGALTGSAVGGALVGSSIGRGAETKVEQIVQTAVFLNNGIQLFFDGTAARNYYSSYFSK